MKIQIISADAAGGQLLPEFTPSSQEIILVKKIYDDVRAKKEDERLRYIQDLLDTLAPAGIEGEYAYRKLFLESLGRLFNCFQNLTKFKLKDAREKIKKTAEGFKALVGQQELYNVALAINAQIDAMIALMENNIGLSIDRNQDAQTYFVLAGKEFSQDYKQDLDINQVTMLFAQAAQHIEEYDFSTGEDLINKMLNAAKRCAEEYYQGKPLYSYLQALGYTNMATYKLLRIRQELSLFDYDGLASRPKLSEDASRAMDLLAKPECKAIPGVEDLVSMNCGLIELLDSYEKLSLVMNSVLNSTFGRDLSIFDDLRQKVSNAKLAFSNTCQDTAVLVRACDQLSSSIKHLEQITKSAASVIDLIRFLLPIKYFRRKAVERVLVQIRKVSKLHGENISILAHSFGSYIVAEILTKEDIEVRRLIFCGSIVPSDHIFVRQVGRQINTKFINDCSRKDYWPALAESVTIGYGCTGTYGFHSPGVKDRRHKGLGHSEYLTADFCRKYWIPFFEGKPPVPGDEVNEKPPLWLQAVSTIPIFKLKHLVPLVLLATLIWWKWDYLMELVKRLQAPSL